VNGTSYITLHVNFLKHGLSKEKPHGPQMKPQVTLNYVCLSGNHDNVSRATNVWWPDERPSHAENAAAKVAAPHTIHIWTQKC